MDKKQIYPGVIGSVAQGGFKSYNFSLQNSQISKLPAKYPQKKSKNFDQRTFQEIIPVPIGWTAWSHVELKQGDLTVQQYLDAVPLLHILKGVQVKAIQALGSENDTANIFEVKTFSEELTEIYAGRREQRVSEVYQQMYGAVPSHVDFILLTGRYSLNSHPVTVPPLKLYFR